MAAKLSIAIIGPAWPLRGGGMSTFNERMATAFQDAGHQVKIYTFSLQYPSFLFPGTTQMSDEPAPPGLDIEVCINSINPLNWLTVGNRIARARHDLVIIRFWIPFMGPCLGTIARRIRKNRHSKVVVLADNVVPHEARPADKWLTGYLFGGVGGAITMSGFVTEQLRRFTQKSSLTLHHPLYDNFGTPVPAIGARQKLGLKPAVPVLLFFGFIRQYKGLDLLLEALCSPAPQQRDWQLLIAGEFYGKPDEYLRLIERPELKNRVVLHTSFIPNSEVRVYFSAADFVIQPYRSATQSGVTPLAYHFDKPMLVTNVGALPEMVPAGSVGEVVEPDVDSISKGIFRLLENGSSHYAAGIERQKRSYSWAYFVDQITNWSSALD